MVVHAPHPVAAARTAAPTTASPAAGTPCHRLFDDDDEKNGYGRDGDYAQ